MGLGVERLVVFLLLEYSKYINNKMKIVPPLESLLGSPSGPCDMLVPEADVMSLSRSR